MPQHNHKKVTSLSHNPMTHTQLSTKADDIMIEHTCIEKLLTMSKTYTNIMPQNRSHKATLPSSKDIFFIKHNVGTKMIFATQLLLNQQR